MNIEEHRLQTFNDWPSDAAVTPRRIAKAGFFYTKQDITVECFACHIQISDWSYGDQVMAKHKLLSPNCPFVLNPTASENIPIATCQQSPRNYAYESEESRLQSFSNWQVTHIVTPQSLAHAGFFSLQQDDITKCFYCNGVVGAWEAGDDPDVEHRRLFPQCPFVLNTINPRLSNPSNDVQTTNVNVVGQDNLAELGVQAHKGPKTSKYATLDARLASFTKWPEYLIQTPNMLAQAGFYYQGNGDLVRCFHCDGGLRDWDPHDEPWTEHARWFPHCGFVILQKGRSFIHACAPDLDEDTKKELQINRRPIQHRKEVTERDVQIQMLLPPAVAAFSIGLHVEGVKRAIREKLQCTGVGFSTQDALIEATLNLQCEEEDADQDAPICVNRMLTDVLQSLVNEEATSAEKTDVKGVEASTTSSSAEGAPKPEETSTTSSCRSLEEENRLLKEARLCKICMDCEVGIVFLPCGHLTTCINCAPNLQDCPLCRSRIRATVRTFLS